MPAPQGTGYAGPPEYIVIEPLEPDYVYVPVYDPVVIYGPGYWAPAYTKFSGARLMGDGSRDSFGAAASSGPRFGSCNWGHPGYAAIQTNTVLYSNLTRSPSLRRRAIPAWKFDAAIAACLSRSAHLQKRFGMSGREIPGVRTFAGRKPARSSVRARRALHQGVQGGKRSGNIRTAQHRPHPEHPDDSDIQNKNIQCNKTIPKPEHPESNDIRPTRTSRQPCPGGGRGDKGGGNKNAGRAKKQP